MTPYILLVDDEKAFLNDQQKLLRKYGIQYRYTTRADGIEKAFDNTKIDFIHLDILLEPGAKDTDWKKPTGLSMIHKVLRTRELEIPIMIISGHIDDKAREMAEEEYGLKDLIVKWYHKPVEYERVLIDTIKKINEKEFKKTKELMLNYARASTNENYSLIETALTTMPMIKYDIALDPNLLLGALESLSFRLLKMFPEQDEEDSVEFSITGESGGAGEGKFERYTRNFKEIVTEHICDYFRNSTDKHRILAESFAALIAKVDLENDKFKTGVVWETMLDIIELFRKKVIEGDKIHDECVKMEELFGVRTGLAFDSPGKLNEYLDLVMKRG